MTVIEDATGTPRPSVARYLAAVEAELADLPDDERTELLEDLASHLAEVADEAGDEDLESRLGSPSAYAAELRASAGLGPPSASAGPEWRPDRLLARARTSAPGRRIVEWWPELRIAGWFVVGAIVTDGLLRMLELTGTFLASGPLQLLGGVVALRLARRAATTPWGRRVRYAVVGVAAVAGVVMMFNGWDRDRVVYYDTSGPQFYPGGPGYTSDGRPITNVYPYSLDGLPLEGVLLYDQDGIPINAGDVYDRTPGGLPIPANQYPRPATVYDDGTYPPTIPGYPPVTTAPQVSTLPPASTMPGSSAPEDTVAPETTAPLVTAAPETTATPETTAPLVTTVPQASSPGSTVAPEPTPG